MKKKWRFPFFPQYDVMDCGPACLRMIAKYYGKSYTLQTLREKCYITREGVSMLGISDAAENIGFRTLGVQATVSELTDRIPLPCILYWNQSHFVVLYRIKKTRNGQYLYYIADPDSQLICYTQKDFIGYWCSQIKENEPIGAALLLIPNSDIDNVEDEAVVSIGHGLLHFFKYIMFYKKYIFHLFGGLIIGTVLQMLLPILTQIMVDFGIGEKNWNFIVLVFLAQFSIFVAHLSIGFIRSWIMLHINSRIEVAFVSDFLQKLMKLPLRYFDTKMVGDIIQRIDDHDRIRTFITGDTVNFIFSVVNFVVFAGILGYYHFKILILLLLGSALSAIWILSFMRYRRDLDIKGFNQSVNEQSKLIQLVEGMQEIKLNNCETRQRWEWEHIQVKLFKIKIRGLSLQQLQEVGVNFLTQGVNILISFIAARAVIDGQMTLGMMMSLTYMISQVVTPINEFIGFTQSWQDAKISLERLNEVHSQQDEENGIETKTSNFPLRHDIIFDDVTFSYSGADRDYAVKNLTLKIPENKVTAIVGESGSGKTTILKMLQGFYEPLRGKILIGGTPLSFINIHLWRSKVGSVMQDSYIFSDSIARNIAISTERIDKERLQKAVRVANIEDFIMGLPLGYDTKLGMEGSGISAGQRQRILMARAVYKDPDFIFFDEATNSLDANNESVIMDNLKEFYHGKTVLVVAHRLSTIREADKIVVIDKGSVVEEGTHEQLTEIRGAYYRLVKNQFEIDL